MVLKLLTIMIKRRRGRTLHPIRSMMPPQVGAADDEGPMGRTSAAVSFNIFQSDLMDSYAAPLGFRDEDQGLKT